MTDREAMRMALEALEYAQAIVQRQLTTKSKQEYSLDQSNKAIEALRQALAKDDHGFDRTASHMAGEYVDTAQPKQEFKEKIDNYDDLTAAYLCGLYDGKKGKIITLQNTAPLKREWVGLTDVEAGNLFKDTDWVNDDWGHLSYARAIEAKLKEKNT